MKLIKFIALIALTIGTFCATAQHTNTRNQAFGDNTYNILGFKFVALTDTAGATVDTVELRPASAVTYLTYTAHDSADVRLRSTATCYKGDRVIMDIINSGPTSFVYLSGYWIVSTGTAKITLTSGKRCHIEWYFDGKNFVETSRNLNYTY